MLKLWKICKIMCSTPIDLPSNFLNIAMKLSTTLYKAGITYMQVLSGHNLNPKSTTSNDTFSI